MNSPASSGRTKLNATSATLDELMKSLQQQGEAAISATQNESNVETTTTRANQQAIMMGAEEQSKILRAKQITAQRKATDITNFITREGINTEDVDSLVNQYAIQNKNDVQRFLQLKQTIDRKANTSFLTDPTGWLVNQFTLGDDVNQAQQLAGQINGRNQFIEATAHTSIAVQNANAGKIASISADETTALTKQAQLQAIRDSGAAELKSAKEQGANAKDIYNIQANMAGHIAQVVERGQRDDAALRAEEDRNQVRKDNLELRRQQAIQSQDSHAIAMIQKENAILIQEENLLKKKRMEQEQKDKNDSIQRAGALVGMNIPDEAAYNKLTVNEKKIIEPIILSGGEVLGKNPSDIVQILPFINQKAKSIPEGSGRELFSAQYPQEQKDLLNGMTEMFNREYNKRIGNKEKPESAIAEANSYVKGEYELQRQTAATANKNKIDRGLGNVYDIPDLPTLIKNMPSESGTPVGKVVAQIAATNPDLVKLGKIDEHTLLLGLGEEIRKGTLNIADAGKSVAQFYTKTIENNNNKMNYTRY